MTKAEPGAIRLSKKKLLLLIAAVAVIAAAVVLLLSGRYLASTARLLRTEGSVRLSDEAGVEKSLQENMRFRSGNALRTETHSLAAIGLDSSKIVTLNENSRTEFLKRGKRIQLHLTEGRLFFQVAKPLRDDESFDIRTSTMVVGIRGTSGYVSVDEDGHERLYVTDGAVHVVGTNPVTGEVKEIDVTAGQRITVYLFNDASEDSILFFLEEPEAEQLPSLIPTLAAEDEALLDKICAATSWRRETLQELAADYTGQGSDEGVNVPPRSDYALGPVFDELRLAARSASRFYDGTPLEQRDRILVEGLPEGFTVDFTVEGSQLDAGSSPNVITSYRILDGEGNDVTRSYLRVTLVDGMLTVLPVTVTVSTPDAEKVYDGTELTKKEYEIRGGGGASGAWMNTGYLCPGEDGLETVYVLDGSLRMTGANPLTGESVSDEVPAGTRVTLRLRSELEQGSMVFAQQSVSERELPEEILRLLASDEGLLLLSCADAGWDPAVILELAGAEREPPEDEPAEDEAPPAPGTQPGSLLNDESVRERLVENAADWSITVDTDRAKYVDRALLDEEAELTVPRLDRAALPGVEVTGSRTDAGSSPNSFELLWENAREDNYRVVRQEGKLTVTRRPVTVTTGSAAKIYDGSPLTERTARISGVLEPGASVRATGSRTRGGSSPNTYAVSWGEANPDNYEIVERLGTLTVERLRFTVATPDASKTYDGTPLTTMDAVATLTGNVPPGATATITGSRTDAGSSPNTVTINWNGNDPENYEVIYDYGTLTVNPAVVHVSTDSLERPLSMGAEISYPVASIYGAPPGVTITATGRQVGIGTSPNTYRINWNGYNPGNYIVVEDYIGFLMIYDG